MMIGKSDGKLPCGLDDCTKCEACKYDLPLDAIFRHNQEKQMKNFGIVPMAGNPATAQLIIPGMKGKELKPFGSEPTQLTLPFKDDNKDQYCNGCEFLSRVARPGQQTHNCRCLAVTEIPGGRIIKLKVWPEEKIKKQFWCPIIKREIMGGGRPLILPNKVESALSDEQLERWKNIKEKTAIKEKWLAMPGVTSWDEIKIGKTYHMPPMLKRGRMEIYIANKYCDSLMAYRKGTNARVWLYKQDEDYKFLSEVK